MKVGDLIKWSWKLGTDHWEQTPFMGIVVATRWYKTDKEKIHVLSVLDQTGKLTRVRVDDPTLEVISETVAS